MAKIIQDHEGCIGCGTCVALCPKFWDWSEDGKATLKGSQRNEKGELELEVKEIECNQDAADACPVQVIHIS
ncbi:MAG: ferredoxin [Candidatus Paceibacterota bacterium]